MRFITSFNDVLYDASGRRCVESFRELNPSFEIVAYIEGDNLDPIESHLDSLGAGTVRLDTLPLLEEFFETARDVIPRELGGDAPDEMFPGQGPQSGDVWFRKHMFRWFRKIVALDHATRGYDDVLFWVDCDCFCKAPLPRKVIEDAFRGAGIIHMKAKRDYSETGLVGYDLGVPGVRELIADMKEHYLSRRFVDHHRWDDCITLDLHRERPGAPPSRDVARRAIAEGQVLPTTPFGRYLEHDKGLHSRKLGLVD